MAQGIVTDYLCDVFSPSLFQTLVEETIRKAREIREDDAFDTIAFSGTSGCALGFILGHALDVPIICIRRHGEESHYHAWREENNRAFEGNSDTKRYLIVDDFIASGNTVNRIMDIIRYNCGLDAKCVAMLMYRQAPKVKVFHPRDADLSRTHENGIFAYSLASF